MPSVGRNLKHQECVATFGGPCWRALASLQHKDQVHPMLDGFGLSAAQFSWTSDGFSKIYG